MHARRLWTLEAVVIVPDIEKAMTEVNGVRLAPVVCSNIADVHKRIAIKVKNVSLCKASISVYLESVLNLKDRRSLVYLVFL